MRKFLLSAVGVICLSLFANHAASLIHAQTKSDEPDVARAHAGHELFEKNCQQCHAVVEGQYSFGPNLYHEMTKPASKKTATEIALILKNGKGKMPPFGERLTSSDVEDLIAYIRTL